MELSIKPMDAASAHEVIGWRYDVPYNIYNINVTPDTLEAEIAHFTRPDHHYFAIFGTEHDLVGHCCFMREARVPGGDYSQEALDMGIGMRPDWTGQGNGSTITRAVIDFGIARYQPVRLRATVAAWNERAQKVCTHNGFQLVDRFTNPKTYREFVILVLEL